MPPQGASSGVEYRLNMWIWGKQNPHQPCHANAQSFVGGVVRRNWLSL